MTTNNIKHLNTYLDEFYSTFFKSGQEQKKILSSLMETYSFLLAIELDGNIENTRKEISNLKKAIDKTTLEHLKSQNLLFELLKTELINIVNLKQLPEKDIITSKINEFLNFNLMSSNLYQQTIDYDKMKKAIEQTKESIDFILSFDNQEIKNKVIII